LSVTRDRIEITARPHSSAKTSIHETQSPETFWSSF